MRWRWWWFFCQLDQYGIPSHLYYSLKSLLSYHSGSALNWIPWVSLFTNHTYVFTNSILHTYIRMLPANRQDHTDHYCFECLRLVHTADSLKKPPPCVRWDHFRHSQIRLFCDESKLLTPLPTLVIALHCCFLSISWNCKADFCLPWLPVGDDNSGGSYRANSVPTTSSQIKLLACTVKTPWGICFTHPPWHMCQGGEASWQQPLKSKVSVTDLADFFRVQGCRETAFPACLLWWYLHHSPFTEGSGWSADRKPLPHLQHNRETLGYFWQNIIDFLMVEIWDLL